VTPIARPIKVVLVALGGVGPRLLVDAGAALREVLGLAPRAGPSLDRPAYAFNKERGQYHAPAIVRRLASLRAGVGGAPVLGVVDVDLFLPDAPYVIGDSDRDAGAALFSVARLTAPDPDQARHRVQVEALHAAGHLLGLSHCADARCAMFLARDAADTDRKGTRLCGGCRSTLGLG
jgi:archaemetzincin